MCLSCLEMKALIAFSAWHEARVMAEDWAGEARSRASGRMEAWSRGMDAPVSDRDLLQMEEVAARLRWRADWLEEVYRTAHKAVLDF